jgi:hypothetical protein
MRIIAVSSSLLLCFVFFYLYKMPLPPPSFEIIKDLKIEKDIIERNSK